MYPHGHPLTCGGRQEKIYFIINWLTPQQGQTSTRFSSITASLLCMSHVLACWPAFEISASQMRQGTGAFFNPCKDVSCLVLTVQPVHASRRWFPCSEPSISAPPQQIRTGCRIRDPAPPVTRVKKPTQPGQQTFPRPQAKFGQLFGYKGPTLPLPWCAGRLPALFPPPGPPGAAGGAGLPPPGCGAGPGRPHFSSILGMWGDFSGGTPHRKPFSATSICAGSYMGAFQSRWRVTSLKKSPTSDGWPGTPKLKHTSHSGESFFKNV